MTASHLPTITVRKGERPAYLRVAEAIRTLISEQGLGPGVLLPTEKRLQEGFGVSRATVREALALLEREHVIDRQQGKGTFVGPPPLERNIVELTSFSEDMRKHNLIPTGTLLEWTERPAQAPDELSAMGPVVRMVRLRLANGHPFGLHDAYLPAALLQSARVGARDIEVDPAFSLYARLAAVGTHVQGARERITARAASHVEAAHLLCPVGSPLLAVRRVSVDQDGQLIEVVDAAYVSAVYPYTIDLERR